MYNVILDETDYQPKHLQMLSYKLAHMYFNLSVSSAGWGSGSVGELLQRNWCGQKKRDFDSLISCCKRRRLGDTVIAMM